MRCTEAEMDLRVGGHYRIANLTPDGMTMWIAGTFSRVDRPGALAYTWAVEPVESDADVSLVEVAFDEADGGTMVTIVHTRIPTPEARDMNLAGWTGCLEGLDALLGDD